MKRRSTEVSGCVNFPVNEPAWSNSNEGGMVVKLVVTDDRDFDVQWGKCCGAATYDVLTEVLLGDDKRPPPGKKGSYETTADLLNEQTAFGEWESYHFPHLHAVDKDLGSDRYLSREYLATLVLGSTGWSGWSEETKDYWTCTFEDLTEEGKAAYRQLESLYPGCELHLLTYLDT